MKGVKGDNLHIGGHSSYTGPVGAGVSVIHGNEEGNAVRELGPPISVGFCCLEPVSPLSMQRGPPAPASIASHSRCQGRGPGARCHRWALALRGDSGAATVSAEAEAPEQVRGGAGARAGGAQLVPCWGSAQHDCVLYVFLDDMSLQVFSHFLAL